MNSERGNMENHLVTKYNIVALTRRYFDSVIQLTRVQKNKKRKNDENINKIFQ